MLFVYSLICSFVDLLFCLKLFSFFFVISPSHSLSRNRNDNEWINSLHNYSYQMNPMSRPTKDYRKNQAAALFEERKRHYEAQQLNYLRYIDKLNGRKSHGNSTLNSHMMNGLNSSKKIRDIYLPEPDYSPSSHRDETFDTRPPLRSALRSSRY